MAKIISQPLEKRSADFGKSLKRLIRETGIGIYPTIVFPGQKIPRLGRFALFLLRMLNASPQIQMMDMKGKPNG